MDKMDSISTQYKESILKISHPAFGENYCLNEPEAFDDARCRIIEDTKPEVVSFHFGLPDSTLLARVKAVGSRIMASATTVAEARFHTFLVRSSLAAGKRNAGQGAHTQIRTGSG